MSADKNYSEKLSVIYNLQSCKIVPVEAKSDNVEESTPQIEYSFPKMHTFLPPLGGKAEVALTDKILGSQAPFLLHIQSMYMFIYTTQNESLIKQDSLHYM